MKNGKRIAMTVAALALAAAVGVGGALAWSWANPLPTPEGDYLEEADLQELLDNPYTFVQEFLPYLHYSPEEGVYRFPMTVEGESCWLQVEGAEDLEAPTLIQLETQEGEVLRTYEMAPLPPEG